VENRREPIFNLPAGIVAIGIFLTAIHSVRQFLDAETDFWVVLTFGFIPVRFDTASDIAGQLPGGVGADVWTFVTYAFLHGNWVHLGVNLAWMVAFGTPVLRRFGTVRFLLLSLAAAVVAAVAHLATHWGEIVPVIGASGAISGQMGAAVRFAFQRHVMFGAPSDDDSRWRQPALPLLLVFRDIRVVAFVAVWFAVNYVFGTTAIIPGQEAPVAWQAHIGGFLAGLLLFPLFDPPRPPVDEREPDPRPDPDQ
jgi:membrane associated rhomboid family serine protease